MWLMPAVTARAVAKPHSFTVVDTVSSLDSVVGFTAPSAVCLRRVVQLPKQARGFFQTSQDSAVAARNVLTKHACTIPCRLCSEQHCSVALAVQGRASSARSVTKASLLPVVPVLGGVENFQDRVRQPKALQDFLPGSSTVLKSLRKQHPVKKA